MDKIAFAVVMAIVLSGCAAHVSERGERSALVYRNVDCLNKNASGAEFVPDDFMQAENTPPAQCR